MQTRTVRVVLFWCLPTFVVLLTTIVLVGTQFCTSLPFHHQMLFGEIWMGVVVFLPVPIAVAAVKSVSLRFRTATERCIWQPVIGWGGVLTAAVLNVLFYRVVADTLR